MSSITTSTPDAATRHAELPRAGNDDRTGWAHEHLALLASAHDLLELRTREARTGIWNARFLPGDAAKLAARLAVELSATHDVYVGVLPRARPRGRSCDVVPAGSTVWVDLDDLDALQRARDAAPAPSLIVASGTSGHAHAYWSLMDPLPKGEIERLNRGLAVILGGDPASIDAARVLRVAGTFSYKHQPPVLLPILSRHAGTVSAAALHRLASIPNEKNFASAAPAGPPPRSTRAARCPAAPMGAVDRMETLEPEIYVQVLTGQRVGESRKVRCPLHDDGTPSLHVYATAGEGWFCFGCRRGGSVYDLAGALWDRPLRGPGFLDLRADLLRELAPHLPSP